MVNREELSRRWKGYCAEHVPAKPVGFDQESYVFAAEEVQIPVELSKQMPAGDRLVKLGFHQDPPERGLGSFNRSEDDMKELTKFLGKNSVRMAFGYELGKGDDVHVVADPSSIAGRDIWFIGDVHGDLLAFRSLMAFIASNSERRPICVFLGDLFDRNPFGLNVLIEAVRLLRDDPSSVFFIAGNHDDGLECTDAGFSSRITPHQFSDELNDFGSEAAKGFARAYIQIAKRLPVGLVLPNGTFVTHGGVPSRPERSVKNIWEGLDAKGIKKLISEKRSEFLCNRLQKDVSTGTKISPDFSWMEVVNFAEAIEKAYGAFVRSMVRGHDHCDLCRHEWARSSFAGNDYCPPGKADRVRDILTMTSMVMMYKEDGLPGFMRHKTSYPTVARYDPQDFRPHVYTVAFDSAEVLKYCDEARKPISLEKARVVAGNKAKFEAERASKRAEQDAVDATLMETRAKLSALDKAVADSEASLNSWRKKKESLDSRPVKDTKKIIAKRERIEKLRGELLERKRSREDLDAREKRGEIVKTRLDDLGDAIKKGCQFVIGSTDDDLRSEIEELEREIGREREAEKARDPERIKADECVRDSSRALESNKSRQAECRSSVENLERRRSAVLSDLNRLNDELARCNEAARLVGEGEN